MLPSNISQNMIESQHKGQIIVTLTFNTWPQQYMSLSLSSKAGHSFYGLKNTSDIASQNLVGKKMTI